jgi:hypothetical protein
MCKHTLIRTGVASVLAAAALLLTAGCGSSNRAASSSTPSRVAAGTTTPRSPCEQVFTERSEELTSDQDVGDALVYVAAYAPHKCRSLEEADLAARETLGEDVGAMVTDAIAGVCREQGVEIGIADTELCRESAIPVSTPGSVFEQDFAGGCGSWYGDRDHFADYSCTDGVYRVVVKDPARPQHSRLWTGRSYKSLAVEADSRLVAPSQEEFELHGVSCWTTDGLGYLFLVAPDGSFGIVKESAGKNRLIKQGTTDAIERGAGPVNTIRGECRGGRDTELRLLVNGSQVAAVRDRRGTISFTGFGISVATSEPNTQVEFDNIEVTSL